MRIVFMGTGEIALPCLRALLESRHEVCAVVTQPDRPVGRHQELHSPGPKVLAEETGIRVLQPERLRTAEELSDLESLAPELIVVMAYGQILPKLVLDLPSRACINVHASLLPRHRGASCIQAAIAEGDASSGVTIMHVAEALDTGDVILRMEDALRPDDTGGSVHNRFAELSPPVLLEAIEQIEAGTAARQVQDEMAASYAPKLLRSDGKIDWSLSSEVLERRIRAYEPWPGTFALFKDGKGRDRRLKIFAGTKVVDRSGSPGEVQITEEGEVQICCGSAALLLADVQPEGGRRMKAGEFAVGLALEEGGRLF